MSRLALIVLMLLSMVVAAGGPGFSRVSDNGDDAEDAPKSAAEMREQEVYDLGRESLEEGEWQAALDQFSKVIRMDGRRADGALYWKAYVQNKLGRRSEALSTLETLRSSHPSSRWLDDGRALEVEIKQASGRPVSPDDEDTEDLKLMALNGLLNMDPERAVPMLEKFIQSGNTPQLKERALFVLVQTGSPRARTLVTRIAKGQSNPELQRKALEYLGIFGDEDAHRLLREVYAGTSDDSVKQSILQAWMTSSDRAALLSVAKDSKAGGLRDYAIQLLGAQGADDELWEMYRTDPSIEVKERVLQALAVSGASDRLMEVARGEKDVRLRAAAIQGLGISGGASGAGLKSMYWSEKDREVRRAVLNALFVQGDAGPLIDIARRETDPEMRREVVSRLSVMGSKEATDFMLELLNK